MFKPIKEVDESTPALRGIWWNPVEKEKLPSWKVFAVLAVVAIGMLGAEPLVGLLFIAGVVAFVVMKIRANSNPVAATSLAKIRREISEAVEKTVNQMGTDLSISADEFRDAKSQNLLLVISQGSEPTFRGDEGVYAEVETFVAIVTPRGLGYLNNTYDTIDAGHLPGTRELILWKKVSRVVVSQNSLEIHVGSSPIVIPLDPNNKVESPGFGKSITTLVSPFVRESQRRLEANA